MKKLVIDLGHGGNDPGAIGQGETHEADIVLAIGKKIDVFNHSNGHGEIHISVLLYI